MSRRGRPPNNDPKRLKRITEELDEAAQHFGESWGGRRHGEIPKDEWEIFQEDLSSLETAVKEAIRAGVLDHPVVHHWRSAKRSFGDRDWLRQFKVGLETGVKPTLSNEDTLLMFEAHALIYEEEIPYTKVRRMVLNKLNTADYKPPSWLGISETELEAMKRRLKTSDQNFYKWLKRLNLV